MSLILPRRRTNLRMINVIQRLGLTTSLQLCLDAGDADSYTSGQTWADQSGNGYNFYRGSTGGSDATDPTFTGVAGRQSAAEYFAADGGDAFRQVADHGFMDSWHKDGATFTVAGWVWLPSGMASIFPMIFSTDAEPGAGHGASVQISGLASTGRISMNYENGSTVQACFPPTNDVVVEGAWMFAAMSFSEGSGASFVRANGTVELLSSDTFTSPSSTNPDAAICILGKDDGAGGFDTGVTDPAPNGSRINSLMAWNRALSQAEITSLYNATKAKFGL